MTTVNASMDIRVRINTRRSGTFLCILIIFMVDYQVNVIVVVVAAVVVVDRINNVSEKMAE